MSTAFPHAPARPARAPISILEDGSPLAAGLRRLRSPLGSLASATLAAGLCGACLHPRAFAVAAGLAALMALGAAWPWLSLRGIRGSLAFDRPRAREGETVAATLSVRNRAPWPAWGLAVRWDGSDGPGLTLDSVGARRSAEVVRAFVPPCRGVYPAGPPRASTGFPFGLRESARDLDAGGRLVVWPRTFPVGPIPEAACGRDGEGAAPRDAAGHSGDIRGVRPYRRGDSLRRVHWPQTARTGRLIVCEREATARPVVQVVLDAHPDAHRGAGPGGSLEWAVRVAASFAEGWLAGGAEVELVAGGRAFAARSGPVAARRATLLDALARLDDVGAFTLADLLDSPECRRFAGGLRVVVATDLGLRRLPARPASPGVAERFAVLRAGAFDDEGEGSGRPDLGGLPVRPWLVLDDPARVEAQVRRSWKEVPLGR